MSLVTTAALTVLGGFQQGEGGAGGDWPAEAIGLAIGGVVVLIAAGVVVTMAGRRPPRSDEQSPDG